MRNWYERFEELEQLPPEERPTFQELEQNAEAGVVRRGIARYLITQNPERSIKMHTMLGTPLVRKAVMGTVGRIFPSGNGGNYRLDRNKSRIEAANNFALNGSVANEGLHTGAVMQQGYELVSHLIGHGDVAFNSTAIGINLALIALQRYNRARMVKRVDEELSEGNQFRPDYKNWLGIDARAVENYRETVTVTEGVATEVLSAEVEPSPLQPPYSVNLPYQSY